MTTMNDAEREAVEVVGWVDPKNIERMKGRELCGFTIEGNEDSSRSCAVMTVAQHQRILEGVRQQLAERASALSEPTP